MYSTYTINVELKNSIDIKSFSEVYTLEDQHGSPTNHPFRKEHDLNQTSMIMFHVNLQGCKHSKKQQKHTKAHNIRQGGGKKP